MQVTLSVSYAPSRQSCPQTSAVAERSIRSCWQARALLVISANWEAAGADQVSTLAWKMRESSSHSNCQSPASLLETLSGRRLATIMHLYDHP